MPEQKIDVPVPEMEIRLNGIGKKYSGRWIFRNINAHFNSGSRVAVTGPNGSGKSTLLQIVSGFISASEGKAMSMNAHGGVSFSCVLAAPYLDLPEELTLSELTDFYFSFKKTRIPVRENLKQSNLHGFLSHSIKEFSSGMKQKVKLSLAFSSEADVYIFDEPCSHLDEASMLWYQKSFLMLPEQAIVLVGSNSVQSEIFNCNQSIQLG